MTPKKHARRMRIRRNHPELVYRQGVGYVPPTPAGNQESPAPTPQPEVGDETPSNEGQ